MHKYSIRHVLCVRKVLPQQYPVILLFVSLLYIILKCMDSVRGYFEFNLLFQLVGFVACYKRFERLVTMGTGSLSPVEFFWKRYVFTMCIESGHWNNRGFCIEVLWGCTIAQSVLKCECLANKCYYTIVNHLKNRIPNRHIILLCSFITLCMYTLVL